MIICEDKKVCFIHIYKTSGSSLTEILGKYINLKHKKKAVTGKNWGWQEYNHVDTQHSNLRDALKIKGIDFKGYNFISIVRNPYDWIGSVWYNAYGPGEFKNNVKFEKFSDYIDSLKQGGFIWLKAKSQYDFIQNDNNIDVQTYKFEEESHLEKICEDNNLEFGLFTHGVSNVNNTPKKRFALYNYTEKELLQVNELLKIDFNFFNYKMYSTIMEMKKDLNV